MLKTVGQLKAELANWDDNTPLTHYVGFGLMEEGLDMRLLDLVDIWDDPEQPISETNIATLHKDDPFLKNIPEERILGRYTALGTQSWK